MNARKYARGSRSPRGSAGRGPRVPRGGGRGRGGSKNKGCALILFAFAALPAIVAAVMAR